MSISADGRNTSQQASLGELVALATRDMSLLVHQEIDLAKAELKQQAMSAALGVGFLAVAAGLGFGVLIAVTIFLGELFTWAGVERFWAYLLTAGVYVVVAGLLALFAANRLKRLHAPERTIQTVRDDVAFLRNPTASATRSNSDDATSDDAHGAVGSARTSRAASSHG